MKAISHIRHHPSTIILDRQQPDVADFFHPDYRVGCGGTEVPTCYGGRWYLYVWNVKTREHEYYDYSDDVFRSEAYLHQLALARF